MSKELKFEDLKQHDILYKPDSGGHCKDGYFFVGVCEDGRKYIYDTYWKTPDFGAFGNVRFINDNNINLVLSRCVLITNRKEIERVGYDEFVQYSEEDKYILPIETSTAPSSNFFVKINAKKSDELRIRYLKSEINSKKYYIESYQKDILKMEKEIKELERLKNE